MNKKLLLYNNYLIKKNRNLANKSCSIRFDIPINIKKNQIDGVSDYTISEYFKENLENINLKEIILSSLKIEFDKMSNDYNNNIINLGVENKESFFYNKEIKINKIIDYLYLYKTVDHKPLSKFISILNDKLSIVLSEFATENISFKVKFNLYYLKT